MKTFDLAASTSGRPMAGRTAPARAFAAHLLPPELLAAVSAFFATVTLTAFIVTHFGPEMGRVLFLL